MFVEGKLGEVNKFLGNSGNIYNFLDIGGIYAICIIGLGGMDAPAAFFLVSVATGLKFWA